MWDAADSQNVVICSKLQLPILPMYALTIHKARSMKMRIKVSKVKAHHCKHVVVIANTKTAPNLYICVESYIEPCALSEHTLAT